jgi:ribosomal protein S21
MIKVVARENETVDDLLRRFKRQVSSSEVKLDLKLHECYMGKADKKKIKEQWRRRFDR